MARKKKETTPTPKPKPAPGASDLHAIRHADPRPNIPTEELRDFVPDDETTPKTMLYPRDPSLDPQLVWKGKDEQDRAPLEVDVVPIYIQEVVEPRAVIEAVRARKTIRPDNCGFFPGFYDDYDSLDFDHKIEFYKHDQKWANRMVLGDSIQVMTSLAEKERLGGRVQTIFIDPPYGIRFGSNWQVSTRKRDLTEGRAEDTTRQPEQIKAFRDTWKLGVNSYLSYLRDRLCVSRNLLTETGSIFVQIGDENIHLVKSLLDEIFGSENSSGMIIYQKTGGFSPTLLPMNVDFILWYAKNKDQVKYRQLFEPIHISTEDTIFFDFVEDEDGSRRPISKEEKNDPSKIRPGCRLFSRNPLISDGYTASLSYDFEFENKKFSIPKNSHWKTTYNGMQKLRNAKRLAIKGNVLRFVRFLEDSPVRSRTCLWTDTGTGGFVGDAKTYVVQTDTRAITRCVLMTTEPGDLVLDPTCGSGTTAFVAEQWGRRWITIDTSRVALALARTRLMAAKYPYYLLADTPEGLQKEADLAGQPPPTYPTAGDVRKGFVYKRVPHVTLKSIANNPDIREGMTRAEIDAAIARHAETETLYDQPYEDKSRVRVSGPFTVESLSPDRIAPTDDEERPASERSARNGSGRGDFTSMVLDNLRKAGVQNTFKAERLTFDRLEPFAGDWVHAKGEYTDGDGKTRRVAVTVGPEYGTVTPQQVKEAAKEAVQGVGFEILIVCGFAFDPHVAEEAKRFGKLTVLPARMNPDLLIGDALKNTGAGNLFMVFGEPDIAITRDDAGKLVVEVKGVDVYDPTTGAIRSSSTDDIACWFIDSDYNGECFFVRHAYFLGADDPYGKLKRALRAEIDEAQWATLHSTRSVPFDPPRSGRIAVKVINHYGDEVLKVYKP